MKSMVPFLIPRLSKAGNGRHPRTKGFLINRVGFWAPLYYNYLVIFKAPVVCLLYRARLPSTLLLKTRNLKPSSKATITNNVLKYWLTQSLAHSWDSSKRPCSVRSSLPMCYSKPLGGRTDRQTEGDYNTIGKPKTLNSL